MLGILTKPEQAQCVRQGDALKLHRLPKIGEVSLLPLQPQRRTHPRFARTGTVLANSYSTSGVAALPARSTGRGGARNRADRESHALTEAQIANLLAAERHAAKIGLPFTRMITIHWEAAGLPLSGMAKATGRFTDLLAKALARHGSGTAWLWVHEAGNAKGGHVHMLAHVPPHLVHITTKLQRGWLRRITGRKYRARVIFSKPIGGRLGLEKRNPDLHAINLVRALAYHCKGSSQAALVAHGIDQTQQPGGRVIGKRCGTSQNIGAKARASLGED